MSDRTDLNDERFSALIEAYIAHLEGHGPKPTLNQLDPGAQHEARNVFRAIDATWKTDVDLPPFEEDPVAQALGFEPTTPTASNTTAETVILSGPKIVAARQRRHLKPSEVTRQLRTGGVHVDLNWVFKLEGTRATTIPQATAAELAGILGVAIGALAVTADDQVDSFTTWLYSSDFDVQVRSWARQQGRRDLSELADRARGHLLATAKRSSGEGERSQWVAMLRAVLDELA